MTKTTILACLIILFGLTACNKYLEVSPKSSLSENDLFQSEIGFQQALNGIYSQLASRNLYGDNLTMGFVSALAQNYRVSGSGVRFVPTRGLDYTSAEVQGFTTSIWTTSYSAIAGANKIIANTQSKGGVLSENSYALILGEALALRAFLHFDLLRMFGSEYTSGKSRKAIPYKKDVNQFALIPSTTEEVISFCLEDLTKATELLKKSDPILTGTISRQNKINYYAAKALEARIKLYMGDNTGAYAAAKVVTDATAAFQFTTATRVSAPAGSKDRLYLSELVFAIRVRDIKNWVDPGYFRFNGPVTSKLTRTDAEFKTLYETASGGATDFRYLYGIEADGGSPFPSKYWQTYQFNTLDSNRLDQLVPGIRLSEMYYILAETAPTSAEGVDFLNTIRSARGLPLLPASTTSSVLRTEITKEYQKEFYAEGQLFYYYKRKNIVRMQFMSSDIALTKYVLPIPASELEFNPNY